MGLIKAFAGALSNTLANQWLEFFYCDTLANNVLMVKGKHKVGAKSSNTKGEENIISNGSKIVVNEGQCMIIVDDGRVVEICAEPGGYTFDTSASPSIFSGGLGQGIVNSFKEAVGEFKYGGQAGRDQRIYFFNIKEILDNKFGTQNPVPFRVTYPELGRSFTAGVRCNGVYTFKLADPMKFFSSIAGNTTGSYTFGEPLSSQMKSELLDALQPAFAAVSDMGIRYDQIALHNKEVKEALRKELAEDWGNKRGLMLENISINSVTMSPEDMKRIQEFEDRAWNADPNHAAATLVEAQAEAMKAAASNQGGAMMGFMGMNMAQANGGMNAQNLFAMGQQQQAMQQQAAAPAPTPVPAPAPTGDSWTCACGTVNTGKFCLECGKPKPAPVSADGWTCKCGTVNKGKFCAECGSPKPAGAPLYKCDKCGWEPADPKNPPKFCPECGDPFDDSDIQ
ncbi:MAG: SPFH domain-containing protein [Oscillospiraceae bacterium]|nr:SPFH domain-containing protein [Oscillospiraceae bacterium]